MLLSIMELSTAMAFVPGSICDGTGQDNASSTMLRGRHLTIVGVEWSPFLTTAMDPASANPDWPIGAERNGLWAGFDVELLNALAELLGFTYAIEKHAKAPTETWESFLRDRALLGDLVATYWTQTAERQDEFLVPFGHIDYSTSLVTRKAASREPSVWKKTLTVFEPFDPYVWIALIFIILASAVIDYWLERSPDGGGERFGESMYEFSAGILWGGFGTPKTVISAVYQLSFGALVLIISSAYTANLAAFLTVSAITVEPTTMEEVVSSGIKICIRDNDLLAAQYQKLYSTVRFKVFPTGELGKMLDDRTCHAAFMPKVMFETEARTDSIYGCKLKIRPVVPATGNYITNLLRCARSSKPVIHPDRHPPRLTILLLCW